MENNDNLRNFFNKKLNEFDESGDTWDRPDADVREAVLAKIAAPAQPTYGYMKWIWIGGVLMSLLLIGGYVYWLKSGVDDLKLELEQERERVEVLQQEVADLSKKQSAEIAELKLRNDELVALNESVFEKKKELESVVGDRGREIFALREVLPPSPSRGGESPDFQSFVSPSGGGWGEEKHSKTSTTNLTLTETQKTPKLERVIKTENAVRPDIQQEKTATIFTQNIPSIAQKEILTPTTQPVSYTHLTLPTKRIV